MKEIIWVFGVGAIGKKTQMLQAANMQQRSLIRSTLEIPRERVVLPVIVAGQHEDRRGFLRQIYECSVDALFLIHGQDQDLKNGALDEFCDIKSPRCLYVWAEKGTFLQRAKKRKKKLSHQNYDVAIAHRKKWVGLLYEYFEQVLILDT